MQGVLGRLATVLAVLALPLAAAAEPASVENVRTAVEDASADPMGASQAAVENPEQTIKDIVEGKPGDESQQPPPPAEERGVGFADSIRDAFQGRMVVASVAGLALTVLGLVGFAFVTRYISPKEALKNPQRAMLYGFIRGNPGVHLKKLSEEFAMKTSSILWHMRKLESAELVHSERANGFRVFYPVEGGIEIKRVSRAITALQNRNARALYETIELRPGMSPHDLSERLHIHAGTVRWHLRKLREFGLVEELMRNDGSLVYPTPLGVRSLKTLVGSPVEPVSRPTSFLPTPMTAE